MSKHPKTGDKRIVRQPFKIDSMPPEVAEEIQKLRAAGKTWSEISDLSVKFAAERIAISTLQRWYDVRVEQVRKEIEAQAARAKSLAAVFKKNGFEDLPESAVNALGSEIFGAMEAGTPAARQESLGNLVALLARMITAQAAKKRLEVEDKKLALAKKKFEDVKSKADKATNDAATKLGKGKDVTLADINRIRERFGLAPATASGS
ncbi:MAG: DUF3486 family protein [Acidobacteria bacterium]|nr:DUF3486 family protein [Acidobacteriota bacterium]